MDIIKTYISSSIKGTEKKVYIRLFAWGKAYVKLKGEIPLCPIDGGNKPLWGINNYWFYIMKDLPKLLKSDKILLLPGWENSRGCRIELFISLLLNKKIETLNFKKHD